MTIRITLREIPAPNTRSPPFRHSFMIMLVCPLAGSLVLRSLRTLFRSSLRGIGYHQFRGEAAAATARVDAAFMNSRLAIFPWANKRSSFSGFDMLNLLSVCRAFYVFRFTSSHAIFLMKSFMNSLRFQRVDTFWMVHSLL